MSDPVLVCCKRCTYIWLYRGGGPYATCPECRKNNTVTADDVHTADATEVL